MLKKKISLQKELKVLTKNSIILFYQFNNVSTAKWQYIKNEFQKIDKIDNLIFQNKTGTLVLKELAKLQKNGFIGNEYSVINFVQNKQKIIETSLACDDNAKQRSLLKKKDINHLLQGPTFVLGCKTKEHFNLIYLLLKKFSNFLFIGGIYNNQYISHYSVEKLLSLQESTKLDIIQFLEYKKNSSLFFNFQFQYNYFSLLQLLEEFNKKETGIINEIDRATQ